jgi:hypothetical protein
MEYNMSNTNRHKLMAMGKPIKAAKGGEMKKSATKAAGGAKADRQGRALLPGKMAKNLPMIAPQSAYKKGGEAKPSAYDKMQDKKLAAHAAKPAKVAHKKYGGMAKKGCK